VQVSAKPIRDGDIFCLLQGALKPTIIRPRHDCFEIIVIAVRLPEEGFPEKEEYVFTRNLVLVWDWESFSEKFEHPEKYEGLLQTMTGVVDGSTELEDQLIKATRIWNVALILGDVEEYKQAEEKLFDAIKGYNIAFGVDSYPLKSQHSLTPLSWAAGNGYDFAVRQLLEKGRAAVDLDLKDSQYGQTPLSWAADNGHDAVLKLLLDTGKVDVNGNDWVGRTPLSWAAGNGYKAVVKLLLDISKVDVNAEDEDGRTPLSWAVGNGHEEVVKLLLVTNKVDVNRRDW
jgi:ankyrin repeat protein